VRGPSTSLALRSGNKSVRTLSLILSQGREGARWEGRGAVVESGGDGRLDDDYYHSPCYYGDDRGHYGGRWGVGCAFR